MDLMSTAQLLGNFGEFFGAIAVVATLVYLAAQIKQNTKSQEENRQAVVAQSARDIDLYIDNWHLALARDPELKRIMQASQSYERDADEVEHSEWFEIHCLAASLFMAFQAQHRHQVLQVAHGDQSDYQLGIARGMSTTAPLETLVGSAADRSTFRAGVHRCA